MTDTNYLYEYFLKNSPEKDDESGSEQKQDQNSDNDE